MTATYTAPGTLTPVLSDLWDQERSWTLRVYLDHGGYEGLKKAKTLSCEELIGLIKDSGLRGRGGAGFPTGLKWSFLPPVDGGPRYLVVNADESEPGTCKDIPTIMSNPQALIEGIAITSRAIGGDHAFVYLRGEVPHVYRRLLSAVREATESGLLDTGFGLDGQQRLRITAHAGAGAYICGEETALLDSLEGRRGHPRLKPPFPAVAGLYARPTVVNNVETIASVPAILARGAQWYSTMGTEKSKGHGIFSVSGHVVSPGQYEAPFGITMRELIELSGGIRPGHELKFWVPGGSSTPIFGPDELDGVEVIRVEEPLDRAFAALDLDGVDSVWGAAESGEMRPVRRHCRRTLGLSKEATQVYGYWRRGASNTRLDLDRLRLYRDILAAGGDPAELEERMVEMVEDE